MKGAQLSRSFWIAFRQACQTNRQTLFEDGTGDAMCACVEQLKRVGAESLNYLFFFVGLYIGIGVFFVLVGWQ